MTPILSNRVQALENRCFVHLAMEDEALDVSEYYRDAQSFRSLRKQKSQLDSNNGLDQWFLTCGKWRSCQVGNDRSDSRTTASKFNTSNPNVDLLYKSQPFTDCFNGKWRVGSLKSGELEKKG